jgi:hypothetical protein
LVLGLAQFQVRTNQPNKLKVVKSSIKITIMLLLQQLSLILYTLVEIEKAQSLNFCYEIAFSIMKDQRHHHVQQKNVIINRF